MRSFLASVDPTRMLGGAAIVVAIAAALWATGGLVGRGEPPEPTTAAVLTVDPWIAGQPPGEWAAVLVPERIGGLLASPQAVADGVAARDLAAGVLVGAADVIAGAPTGDRTAVNIAVTADRWPADGPQPGDTAMLIAPEWNCALHTLELLDVADGTAVVAADAILASQLHAGVWELMAAPGGGATSQWECPRQPPDGTAVLARVAVDLGDWPGGAPRIGDDAMLLRAEGSCAVLIAPLIGVADSGVVVSVRQPVYGTLRSGEWRLVPPPTDRALWNEWRC